ncbi:hypothetical protein J8J40_32535, partial [Mycobacterium tuberculosis]|nr:hypothetical protein [Mycobacterium tuberculosis]
MLIGEPDAPVAALGYATQPGPRSVAERGSVDRLTGEPINTVATGGSGRVVLAALPPAEKAPGRSFEA